MGFEESELILTSSADKATNGHSSSQNSSDGDTKDGSNGHGNDTEESETTTSSRTTGQDAEQSNESDDDQDKTTKNRDTDEVDDEYHRLLEDFNAAITFTANDESGLFTIFVQEPGKTARTHGAGNIAAIRKTIESVDKFIGQVVAILAKTKLLDSSHVIVASTPGYVDVKLINMITLTDYIQAQNSYIIAGHSPILNIKSEGKFLVKRTV